MRFLHIADVHLDTPFLGRSDRVRTKLAEASREAFRRAVSLTIDEGLDALLVAGDLFDGEWLSFPTEGFLLDELQRAVDAGVTVVYAAGNHDPGREGLRAHGLDWPKGVAVVRDPEPVRIPIEGRSGGVVGFVTAAGHPGSRVTDDLSRAFRPDRRGGSGLPEVALLHTQVVGSRGSAEHDPYAPSERRFLKESGFDYWALGHVHLRGEVCASPPVHYPGNLQGRNPRETGAKGGLVVHLPKGGGPDTSGAPVRPEVEFRALAPIRWEEVVVHDPAAETLDHLVREVAEVWSGERRNDPGEPGTEWIVRVRLAGRTPLWREVGRDEDRAELERQLGQTLEAVDVEVRVGAVGPPLRWEEHLDRTDVLGEALRLVDEARASGWIEGLDHRALAGLPVGADPEERAEYLRELLADAETALLPRVLANLDGSG